MKKLNRSQIRSVILNELKTPIEQLSEMEQFAKSPSGKKVMDNLEENESVSSKLPTVAEFKSVLKELQKLEKM